MWVTITGIRSSRVAPKSCSTSGWSQTEASGDGLSHLGTGLLGASVGLDQLFRAPVHRSSAKLVEPLF